MSTNLYRTILSLAIFATAAMSLAPPATAQDAPETVTLFKNVKVFNGTEDKLHDMDVLVVKNKIHKVAKDIPTTGTWKLEGASGKATKSYAPMSGDYSGYKFEVQGGSDGPKTVEVDVIVIDGGGRTLMPGLIDTHTHFTHAVPGAGLGGLEATNWQKIGAMMTVAAKEHLMSGFTTVREMGGGSVGGGLKSVIDEGYLEGPRIYPSGAYFSQTA